MKTKKKSSRQVLSSIVVFLLMKLPIPS